MTRWTRRAFVKAGAAVVGAAGAGLPLAARAEQAAPAPAASHPLQAKDVRDHLLGLGRGWVDTEKTVDTFKCGDPDAVVRGIAVGWMPYAWALRQAVEKGCNLFVTHEPTFYDHLDKNADVFRFEGARAKRAFVEASGLVVYRCHDVWDQYPGLGIVDAWADVLGLSKPLGGTGYFRVFDGGNRTALEVARDVARRTKPFGQESVHLVGPADHRVTRLAIGCGAITPFQRLVYELQADMVICTDDGFVGWRDGAMAVDFDIPVVVANHAVGELAGIARLADHLKAAFPSVPVVHVAERCTFREVTG